MRRRSAVANPNLGHVIADAWNTMQRETEDPFSDPGGIMAEMFGHQPQTYRQILDRTRVNYFGHAIPRRVTVRRNIRFVLADPKLPASRLPS